MLELGLKIPGTKNFIWAEALYLRQWQIHCYPNEEQFQNIIKLAGKLQYIRSYFNKQVKTHCWVRPTIYNALVGGALRSQHLIGAGVDFHVEDVSVDDVRDVLRPKLEDLKIRMEEKTPRHIHIDIKEVGQWESRSFYP